MPKHLSGWHVPARERRWKYDVVVSSRWIESFGWRALEVVVGGFKRQQQIAPQLGF
jgi:hypothetical protein